MTNLLLEARQAAGLRQEELADRAQTSNTAISAYEHGHKSPTLETAGRVLAAAGFELTTRPRVTFSEVKTSRGRTITVPSVLPRLSVREALASVTLPLHLNWSAPGRTFHLRDRRERAWVYEIVLREGGHEDILTYIDGALLVDLWDEMVLPRDIREAWQPVVTEAGEVAA
ncbi:MAG TPA: helix-turn-helix transcriptional regulator [Amycolatopsis sp.]|uniref:Helix-turn-helix transcriptional regulator n=1 Tax=Amycolatopsis nalaikhensis TaxID=715472 RepID=A0ABY8XP05_9PSEU|nr:helix-turn-helix transcriptional regulator [Amycolatopsis sp. 2-2]WIV57282.1 helix-turn-helix transcriptional regulator [Amycolatopsis sp. 2-2]